MKHFRVLLIILILLPLHTFASQSDALALFTKMRQKLDFVKDYVADVKMKVDISFMRVPPLHGKLYYKAPDKMKLDRKGGISILPRKNINMTLGNLIPSGEATVIDAGYEQIGDVKARIIKVVPGSDQTDIVLTKIWIDEERLLALRTETTTRDNGTIKMDLTFGKYTDIGLPDRVVFFVDVKDYKLPKGVTMDYDHEQPVKKAASSNGRPGKGKIEIVYLNYLVNKGIPDEVFQEKKK